MTMEKATGTYETGLSTLSDAYLPMEVSSPAHSSSDMRYRKTDKHSEIKSILLQIFFYLIEIWTRRFTNFTPQRIQKILIEIFAHLCAVFTDTIHIIS